MLDSILSWLVLWIPVVLGVVVIAIPAKHEDKPGHMRWRYALGACLILYGGLAWWQQSRERTAEEKRAQEEQAKPQKLKQDLHSDFQVQLDQQKKDLILAFVSQAKTPAEREFVERVAPLARMDFGFSNEATGGYDNRLDTIVPNYIIGPARHIGNLKGLPFPTKPVSFKLVGRVSSKLSVKNAHVWVTICNGCDWLKVPDGFKAPDYGPNVLTQLDKPLGDIPAGPIMPIGDFQIAMPVDSQDMVEIGVGYTCDNCAPADMKQQKKLIIHAPLKQP
jgi:hypothetical protein